MNPVSTIGLRNLTRQKRRNLFLGAGIAIGMALLVLSGAFTRGISDILLNRIVVKIAGHLVISSVERSEGREDLAILRNRTEIERIARFSLYNVREVREQILLSGRALGNGRAESVAIVGTDPFGSLIREAEVVEGSVDQMASATWENPVVLYEEMAEDLAVGLLDVIRVRFSTVYGQAQTARFTVVAVIESTNPFLDLAIYAPIDVLRPLAGFEADETQALSVVLDRVRHPREVSAAADRIHSALSRHPEESVGRLLERTATPEELAQKHRSLDGSAWRGRVTDVNSIYEIAGELLQIERVLDRVSLVAVGLLLVIVLIGVVNTLRMTIRERTREIGTLRAIGMQRADLLRSFVVEILALTLVAGVAGAIAAHLAMALLGRIAVAAAESTLSVFLVDDRLHFVPTASDIVKNLAIVVVACFPAAYFPARRAARLSVTAALGHHE